MFGMSNIRIIWMAALIICIFSLFALAYQTRINENASDTMFENFIKSFLWFSGSITLYVVFPLGMICGIIDYTSNGRGGTGGPGGPGMGKIGALAGVGMAGMAAYAAKEKLKAAAGAAKDKIKGAAGAVGRGASAAAGKVKGAAGKVGSKVKGLFRR